MHYLSGFLRVFYYVSSEIDVRTCDCKTRHERTQDSLRVSGDCSCAAVWGNVIESGPLHAVISLPASGSTCDLFNIVPTMMQCLGLQCV